MVLVIEGQEHLAELDEQREQRLKKGLAEAVEQIKRDRRFLQERLAEVNAKEELTKEAEHERAFIIELLAKLETKEAGAPTP